jgi:uncharacterized protein YfaS (alpha-2-macroglobulin family)
MEGESSLLKTGAGDLFVRRLLDFLSKQKKPVAFVQENCTVDDQGVARITFAIPEYTGKVRIFGVGYSADRMGTFMGNTMVRHPIVVDGALPRFLSTRDEAIISWKAHNLTAPDSEYTFTLNDAVNFSNKKYLKKDDHFEWKTPLKSTTEGTLHITSHVQGPSLECQQQFECTITSPFDTEWRDAIQRIEPHGEITYVTDDIIASSSLKNVSMELSRHGGLPWSKADVRRVIQGYAYECTEQNISAAFAALYTNDAEKTEESKRIIDTALSILAERQNAHGSWARWTSIAIQVEDIVVTGHAIEFLKECERKGIHVPSVTYDKAKEWAFSRLHDIRNSSTGKDYDATSIALVITAHDNDIDTSFFRYIADERLTSFKQPAAFAHLGYALAVRGERDRAHKKSGL